MSENIKQTDQTKGMDFFAAHAMIEDVMHNSSGPFVCLLRMGDYTSMMCDEIHLSEVLDTLVTHIWTSLRRHENGPSASAKAILAAALGCLEKENARLSDEDVTDMIREIQSMRGTPASNLDEVVQ